MSQFALRIPDSLHGYAKEIAQVSLNRLPDTGESGLRSMAEFLPPSSVMQPAPPCQAGELASIIYTSGTTGRPKGVMLSHANMLSNAHACLDTFVVNGDDLFLSSLPLSHTFERTLGYYLTVMTGATVAFARSIPQLAEDMQSIRPTLLISVPRIYERIHRAIQAKLDEELPINRYVFHLPFRLRCASWRMSWMLIRPGCRAAVAAGASPRKMCCWQWSKSPPASQPRLPCRKTCRLSRLSVIALNSACR